MNASAGTCRVPRLVMALVGTRSGAGALLDFKDHSSKIGRAFLATTLRSVQFSGLARQTHPVENQPASDSTSRLCLPARSRAPFLSALASRSGSHPQ